MVAAFVFLGVTIMFPQDNFDHFTISIAITVVAALFENLCEPFYVCMLLKMEFQMRAKAESISIFIKSVLIYALIYKGWGLLGYAISQLAYGFMLLIMYSYINMKSTQSFDGFLKEYFTLQNVGSGKG